jgi:hypothetical protein
MAYRIYVTDSLFYQAQNQHLTARYVDLLNKKVDNRSGDEIVLDVMSKAGLRFKEE